MSIEEQQALAKCLSEDKRREFLKRRLAFFTEMLRAFGIRAGTQTVKLLGNLLFSAAILRKAIPDTPALPLPGRRR